jgi:hypothetical protein
MIREIKWADGSVVRIDILLTIHFDLRRLWRDAVEAAMDGRNTFYLSDTHLLFRAAFDAVDLVVRDCQGKELIRRPAPKWVIMQHQAEASADAEEPAKAVLGAGTAEEREAAAQLAEQIARCLRALGR